MALSVNIDKFNLLNSIDQEQINQEILNCAVSSMASISLQGVNKCIGYLSDWDADVVVIDMGIDRFNIETASYDLSQTFLQCKGEMSIFDGVQPLTAFPNLALAAKAYLNILDKVFSVSTKKHSEVTQNFNNLCRFLTWMIQAKGLYRLNALTRSDFIDFMVEMKEKGGWAQMLNLDEALKEIVSDLENKILDIRDVCSSYDPTGNFKVMIRIDYFNKRIGIPGAAYNLPRWFYNELLRFHNSRFHVNVKETNGISYMTIYSHMKSLNRLSDLPDNIDKPSFRPYISAQVYATELSNTDLATVRKKNTDGCTANLSLEDALKLFRESLKWIYDYSKGVLAILELYRNKLEEWMPQFNRYSYKSVLRAFSLDPRLLSESTRLCREYGLPFEAISTDLRSHDCDEQVRPSVAILIKNLMTACFIIVATNHGRRLNEIVGENQLPYGLYFGCIKASQSVQELNLIDIYVEKTVRDWSTFYVNRLVLDAVHCLEELSQNFRPLFTERKKYLFNTEEARKDKLFSWRVFTPTGFDGRPNSYSYKNSSTMFLKLAKVEKLELDHRGHPFRRFFALLYYYRYDIPDLLALSVHLRHLDPGMTKIYLSDPEMRKSVDNIETLFNSRVDEESKHVQADMDEVCSEMFTDTVIEILKGARSGGNWPQLVLCVYKNMSKNAEFNKLDLNAQGKALSHKMLNEGYNRTTLEHGGCNVGTNQITQSESRCKYDGEDFAHLEDAAPNICVNCPHHDCSHLNMQLLRARSEKLRETEVDYSAPQCVRLASRAERESLDRVIDAELRIEQGNRQLLHSMLGAFAKLTSAIQLPEGL